mmetsp:Transcript_95216/g.188643  ORF Transcript_95216/g.188643 Transcript_95216/m.188643 type:complete len:114 (+) Transcript_95216:1055-1396(+)
MWKSDRTKCRRPHVRAIGPSSDRLYSARGGRITALTSSEYPFANHVQIVGHRGLNHLSLLLAGQQATLSTGSKLLVASEEQLTFWGRGSFPFGLGEVLNTALRAEWMQPMEPR